MRLPRFRIRTMMVVVAAIALVAAAGVESRRLYGLSRRYRARATEYSRIEKWAREFAKDGAERVVAASGHVHDTEEFLKKGAQRGRRMQELISESLELEKEYERLCRQGLQKWTARGQHAASLKDKYERAARYPWLPVEPDPPEPE